MVLPCFATHMCIGSPFAWSVMSSLVMRDHGFVASAATYVGTRGVGWVWLWLWLWLWLWVLVAARVVTVACWGK
jgi:hypothetical protein